MSYPQVFRCSVGKSLPQNPIIVILLAFNKDW